MPGQQKIILTFFKTPQSEQKYQLLTNEELIFLKKISEANQFKGFPPKYISQKNSSQKIVPAKIAPAKI